MKQIILVLALLPVFVSCGSRQETTDAESAEPTAKEQPAAQLEKKDTVADAVTGATAVVNPQAFNGIIIVPPQKNVTVTMTMGGTVNSMNMFPGEYVKKGQVIATLKNPEFISLLRSWNFWRRSLCASKIFLLRRPLPKNACSRARRNICR